MEPPKAIGGLGARPPEAGGLGAKPTAAGDMEIWGQSLQPPETWRCGGGGPNALIAT